MAMIHLKKIKNKLIYNQVSQIVRCQLRAQFVMFSSADTFGSVLMSEPYKLLTNVFNVGNQNAQSTGC